MKNCFSLIATLVLSASTMSHAAVIAGHELSATRVAHTTLDARNCELNQVGNFTFATPKAGGAQAGAAKVNVTLQSEAPNGYRPIGMSIYNAESGMFHVDFNGEKKATQAIPKGTYDMFVNYMSNYSELYYVFREQVKIDADTTITLAQSEAKTGISFRTIDQSGNSMHMPVYNTSYQKIEEGTIDDFSSLSFFMLKGFGNAAMVIGAGYKYKGHETDFYINRLSNRYKLCEARVVSKGEMYWFNRYVLDDFSKSVTITNDPTRYIGYNQKFAPTPEWADQAANHVPGYYFSALYNGEVVLGQQSDIPKLPSSDYTTKFYLDVPFDDDKSADQFYVLVKPLMGDFMTEVAYDGGKYNEYKFLRGQQVGGDKDGLRFVNAGYEENGGFNAAEGTVWSKFYPGHPAFSFTPATAPHAVYGEACPINSLRFTRVTEGGQTDINMIPNYVGRYGDLRDADFKLVKQDEPAGDEDVVILTNDNVKVDGLKGKNVTTLTVYPAKADPMPPTMQMLQFKDKNGVITDRFKTPANGVVEIAGGDFNYHYIPEAYMGYYTCDPSISIKVSYAPYGTTDSKELAVEKVESLYFMPGFGHFFRGKLDAVPASATKQWYDLEVVLTDATGNSQKQLISPAFCILGDDSGVETAKQARAEVAVENGTIVAQGMPEAQLQVLATDGRLVATGMSGTIATAELGHGVYVVRVDNGMVAKISL